MLWLYWQNDRYWGEPHPRQWHQAWQTGGGQAEFHSLPPTSGDGHFVLWSLPPTSFNCKSRRGVLRIDYTEAVAYKDSDSEGIVC
jgi:hypothetical protein